MTSREALEEIKNLIIDTYGYEYEKVFDIIEKNLEMLEILKNNLYVEKGTGKFNGIEIIQCSLGNQHSEDFNTVKEWLNVQ